MPELLPHGRCVQIGLECLSITIVLYTQLEALHCHLQIPTVLVVLRAPSSFDTSGYACDCPTSPCRKSRTGRDAVADGSQRPAGACVAHPRLLLQSVCECAYTLLSRGCCCASKTVQWNDQFTLKLPSWLVNAKTSCKTKFTDRQHGKRLSAQAE